MHLEAKAVPCEIWPVQYTYNRKSKPEKNISVFYWIMFACARLLFSFSSSIRSIFHSKKMLKISVHRGIFILYNSYFMCLMPMAYKFLRQLVHFTVYNDYNAVHCMILDAHASEFGWSYLKADTTKLNARTSHASIVDMKYNICVWQEWKKQKIIYWYAGRLYIFLSIDWVITSTNSHLK